MSVLFPEAEDNPMRYVGDHFFGLYRPPIGLYNPLNGAWIAGANVNANNSIFA
jgi:hypothetical protein